MQTHENSDPNDDKGRVEFCFDDKYYQFNDCYSESFTNSTPEQAWRAGFREGVKMCLVEGAKPKDLKEIWWQNYNRLLIWSSVGADVENGIYSILGAREGCYMTMCSEWDYSNVRDFDWLEKYWNDRHANSSSDVLSSYVNFLASELKTKLNLEIANLDGAGSKFFKTVYRNVPRRTKR
jgi:hypothetical protein